MARKNKVQDEDAQLKKERFAKIAATVDKVPAETFLKDNFLPSSWSFVLDRALVDVTGLKPVQRRILYTMYKNNLHPTANKSVIATIGGDVIHYHPHGDASINEALKNLGRAHVFRVPMIDTSDGDFGAPGAPGAAARYLKTRLSRAGWINVEEIGDHAVRMVPSYDNKDVEPVRIPVRWPVAVINGSSGIATGYASEMPSHNPTEVMKAAKLLLRNPDATHAAIQKIVQGPDFNLGGIITTRDGIKEYLETGSGSFKIRGKYEATPGPRNTYRIEFYEIPYGTYPEKVLEQIQDGVDKKGMFEELSSYKDLSDLKHPIRIVFETKPGKNYKKVLQDIFKNTDLEKSFAANITTIVDSKPVQSSMKDLLLDFIKFRKECVINKSQYALGKKMDRLHLVEGLALVLLDIDKAISIIRNAVDVETARNGLMKRFKIDEKQADHVLSLQLRRLTKMDKEELLHEKTSLEAEIEYLNSLINEADVLNEHLSKEFDETLKIIGDERKTEINDMTVEEFVEAEKAVMKELKNVDKDLPCYVTFFQNGTAMKTMEPFSYDDKANKVSDSPIVEQIKMSTKDTLVVVDSEGFGHRVAVSYLLDNKAVNAKGMGVTLSPNAHLVGISRNEAMKSDIGLALATANGVVKVSKTDFPKGGDSFPVISLEDGDSVVASRWIGRTTTDTLFVMVNASGNILAFDAGTVRPSGHKAGGVSGMKMRDTNDKVVYFTWVKKNPENVVISYTGSTAKMTMFSEINPKGRGTMGMAVQLFKSGETEIVDAYVGPLSSAVMAGSKNGGTVLPLPALAKRAARGVEVPAQMCFGARYVDTM